jgi:hypothetical protein
MSEDLRKSSEKTKIRFNEDKKRYFTKKQRNRKINTNVKKIRINEQRKYKDKVNLNERTRTRTKVRKGNKNN